jgi:hypothetical protein
MEAARSSETLVSNNHTTRRNNTENRKFCPRRRESLKSCILSVLCSIAQTECLLGLCPSIRPTACLLSESTGHISMKLGIGGLHWS